MKRFELPTAAAASPLIALAQVPDGKLRQVDAHQLAVVEKFTNLPIPPTGTPAAPAAQLDRSYNPVRFDGAEACRTGFAEGRAAVDRYTQERFGQTFLEASPERRLAVRQALSAAGPARLVAFGAPRKALAARSYGDPVAGHREGNYSSHLPRAFGDRV